MTALVTATLSANNTNPKLIIPLACKGEIRGRDRGQQALVDDEADDEVQGDMLLVLVDTKYFESLDAECEETGG